VFFFPVVSPVAHPLLNKVLLRAAQCSLAPLLQEAGFVFKDAQCFLQAS